MAPQKHRTFHKPLLKVWVDSVAGEISSAVRVRALWDFSLTIRDKALAKATRERMVTGGEGKEVGSPGAAVGSAGREN